MQACTLLRTSQRTPAFTPLSHPLPYPSFQRVHISTSGYQQNVREGIQYLTQLLGGTFHDSFKTPPVTHLLVPSFNCSDSTVKKCKAAQKKGVAIVVGEWLVECAHQGRLVGVQEFTPAGELPAGDSCSTQAAAAELPATQVSGVLVDTVRLHADHHARCCYTSNRTLRPCLAVNEMTCFSHVWLQINFHQCRAQNEGQMVMPVSRRGSVSSSSGQHHTCSRQQPMPVAVAAYLLQLLILILNGLSRWLQRLFRHSNS